MRLKTFVLCSTSLALLALAAPGHAQSAGAQTGPVQTQDAPVDPEAAAPQQDDAVEGEGEEIVVTGLRRSLQSAQAIKRNSDQIVDAIVAEDIGKLPDRNVSESLARITGVQVDRGSGEAGRVLVRGLPDFTTTYNGRDIFTAESRRVSPGDFPAGGVAALEVFKTTTANLVEGGLAGLINVRSRRPFDFQGTEIAGAVNITYADQAGDIDWNGNLLLSTRWENNAGEFGALINFSTVHLNYLDSARFNGGFIETGVPVAGAAGTGRRATNDAERGQANAFRYPDGIGLFYSPGKRWRPSVNAALQWKPSDDLQFYFDGLYQGFRREVSDRLLFVPIFGDARLSNIVLQDGSNRVQSLTSNGQVRPEGFQAATNEKTNTYQFAVGGVYTGERVKISADLARTTSRFDLSILSLDYSFASAPTVNANFDVDKKYGGVEFDFGGFDLTNPANFLFRGFFDRNLIAKGDDVQFRTDLEYETGLAFLPEFQFGVRYVDRDGEFENGERYSFRDPERIPLGSGPLDFGVFRAGFRGSNVQPVRNYFQPTRSSIRDNVRELRNVSGFAQGNPTPDPAQSYTVNEKSYTGYAQIKLATEAPIPINAIVGLRAVRTELSIDTTSNVQGVLTPTGRNNEFTDYLPNASIRAELAERLQLRASFTQTRTRPNFGDLNPAFIINPPGGTSFRTARGGNPNLRPIESDNYDISLEYYPTATSFASVGLFRRDVDGFIANGEIEITDPDFGLLRISSPINGGKGRLEGVEVQGRTFLDIIPGLPDFARGFGVEANFTYITGDQEVTRGSEARRGFEDVSKYTYNLQGFYEAGGLSARLAYNYRSKRPDFFSLSPAGEVLSREFIGAQSRLDFSTSYTPFEALTLAFDVSNILAKPFRNFFEYNQAGETFPRDVRYEERVYSLGVRFRY